MNIPIISIDPGSRDGKLYPGGDITDRMVVARNVFGQINEHRFSGAHIPDFRFEEPWAFSSDAYALKYGGEPTTKQDPSWLISKEFEQIVFTLLAKAKIQDGNIYKPVFVIPIDDWRQYIDPLKERWTGKHSFKLYGQDPVHFEFDEPDITMQATAAAIHWARNGAGEWIHNLLEMDVAVVDCGARDVNIARLNGMIEVRESSHTLRNMGWWDVVYRVGEWLNQEYSIRVNPLKLAEACEIRLAPTEISWEGPQLFWDDRWIDLSQKVDEYTAYYGRMQIAEFQKIIPKDVQTLLICGGNAFRFLPYYQQVRSSFQLIDFASYASCLGGYWLGRM